MTGVVGAGRGVGGGVPEATLRHTFGGKTPERHTNCGPQATIRMTSHRISTFRMTQGRKYDAARPAKRPTAFDQVPAQSQGGP